MQKLTTLTIAILLSWFAANAQVQNLRYSFNNGNANEDIQGSYNGTTFGSATLTSDRFGNANMAYDLGNASGYIDIGNINFTNNVNQLTFAGWFKKGANPESGTFFSKGDAPNQKIELSLYNNVLYAYATNLGMNQYLGTSGTSYADIPVGTWFHVAMVYNAGNIKLYLNNVLNAENNAGAAQVNVTGYSVFIGKHITGGSSFWQGSVDDLHFTNRAMTTVQIDSLYNLRDPLYIAPLKTYCYKFDDGSPNNSCGTTNNGTYIGPWAGLGNDHFGNVNTAYYCGASASGGVDCGDIDIFNENDDFTIAGWVQLLTTFNPNSNRYIFSKGGLALFVPANTSRIQLNVGSQIFNVSNGFGPLSEIFGYQPSATNNHFGFFAITRENNIIKVYMPDGNTRLLNYTGVAPSSTGTNFVIGLNTDMKADDIFIINRALTDTQMDSLRNLPNSVCAAPTITSQISGNSATLCAGSTLTLECAASGSNLSYQWKHNGANVGTNLNTFSVVSTPAATGAYTCVVTNSCGTATTDPFNFTAYTSPAITAQINGSPNNICEGTNITLNIGATGSNLTYQWKRNGINIGTNSSSLNIPNATTANTANYTCVVTGTCDVATSNSFTLNVLPNPTATISQNAGVLTAVSNATNASYEWFLNGISIPGATNATYTPTANGVYRVAVTDLNSSASCNTLSQGFSVNLTGIYNTLATKTLVIAPNPASDYLNINIVLEASSDLTFELSDINAKIVYHEILSNVTEINKNISLENLNKGLYFLRIKDNNGILTSKVIKR